MEVFRMTEFNLRLKASVEANKFRYGYPWIYSNEIISDRRTKSLLPGSFCTLVDYNKNPICLVTVNPNSKIFARVMDFNFETTVDAYRLKDKISKKVDCILVLAWNFFDDIKKNNKSLCKKFVNIKDLEKN